MAKGMDIRSLSKNSSGTKVNPIIPDSDKGTKTSEDLDRPTTAAETHTEADILEYKKFLKKHDIEEADIFSVLDNLLVRGEVYWSFDLLDRIPVVYRSRPSWVNQELLKELEVQNPKTYMRFTNLVNLFNLAGSLHTYGEHIFALEDKDALEKAYQFVNKLPFALQTKLIEKLAIFDRLIAVATSDWALENFTPPQADE
jgi:hypothetical protein